MDDTNEILQRITRLETKIDLLVNSNDIANEALQNSKEANRRLDRIDKIIFWTGTTIIGTVIIGFITMLVNRGIK